MTYTGIKVPYTGMCPHIPVCQRVRFPWEELKVFHDACAGGRVGIAALGGVERARRRTVAGVDGSSVAAASHALAAVASTAMMTLQQTRPLRRRRALQHGGPARSSCWRAPHAHAHCLELPVIPLSFACTPACLAQALFSR